MNTESIAPIAAADEDFSKIACADFSGEEKEAVTSDEEVMEVSRRLIQKNREAYDALSK